MKSQPVYSESPLQPKSITDFLRKTTTLEKASKSSLFFKQQPSMPKFSKKNSLLITESPAFVPQYTPYELEQLTKQKQKPLSFEKFVALLVKGLYPVFSGSCRAEVNIVDKRKMLKNLE